MSSLRRWSKQVRGRIRLYLRHCQTPCCVVKCHREHALATPDGCQLRKLLSVLDARNCRAGLLEAVVSCASVITIHGRTSSTAHCGERIRRNVTLPAHFHNCLAAPDDPASAPSRTVGLGCMQIPANGSDRTRRNATPSKRKIAADAVDNLGGVSTMSNLSAGARTSAARRFKLARL